MVDEGLSSSSSRAVALSLGLFTRHCCRREVMGRRCQNAVENEPEIQLKNKLSRKGR